VPLNTDPTRYFFNDPPSDLTQSGDLGGTCTGGIAWRDPSNTNVFAFEPDAGFDYSSAGHFTWTTEVPSSLTYSATYSPDGSLTVSYTRSGTPYLFVAQRTVAPRRIKITNQDSNAMSNVQVAIEATIGGNPHYDWEGIGNFTANYSLGAIMFSSASNGGFWDGSKWVGDFLYTASTTGAQHQAVITKLDYRDFANVRIHAWFVINGQQYYDYQDMGNWTSSSAVERTLILNTSGVSSSFDGTAMRGDFLR